tara:strand:+ start:325 stop:516 length:192 start_codon:yes stop_codon:yes gene_type:complete
MPTRTQISKGKLLKPVIETTVRSDTDRLQFNLPKDVKDSTKVKEKEVFVGFKPKKKGKGKGKK